MSDRNEHGDRFVVPEPSAKAHAEAEVVYFDTTDGQGWVRDGLRMGLRAAYAVDVPRIVRAEVRRALMARQADPLGFGVAAYLTERYGPQAATAELSLATPQPRVSDVLNERLTLQPEGRPTPAETPPHWLPIFTPERDALQRLERFCKALARIYEISNPGDGRVAKVKDAAREYLRP